MIKGIVLDLFKRYNGIELSFSSLSLNARNSVIAYFCDEFEIDIDDDDLFGYVEIPMDDLKFAIGCPEDLSYKTFDEYHKWYIDGGDIPSHEEVWAIILSDDDREVIFDGWHRFHAYVDKGITIVPCIYPIHIQAFLEAE